ncbi:MAG: 1-acyl-sn-glycerol-3-phosphate acyltransferase [Muribaculaceae bacterium]|nr:1-acyl-sn-glycerol-3-phosphate acyltransferase [Muribaculaceae bacterium]
MSDNRLRIDIDGVLKNRAPGLRKFLPRFVVGWIEQLICQKRLNEMLDVAGHLRDAEFSRAVLDYLRIKRVARGEEHLPGDNESHRVIYVSNHPLGGLDGMALIDYLSQKSPTGRVKFVVNDLLMAVEPLRGVFLPVNKHGGQSRDAASALEAAMAGDDPIVVFPAGLCSRRQNGEIMDLKWNKMFVNKAIAYGRDVIPIHFSGRNSKFFYIFAQIRKRLLIPVNLEMVLLPREVFGNEGSTFEMTIGERISHTSLQGGRYSGETARRIKDIVYGLSGGC